MLYRLRALLVPALLVLGLIIQGMAMPAMASAGSASATSCQATGSDCAKRAFDHHAMNGACQVTCPAPLMLPDLSAARPFLVSSSERFMMTGEVSPAGLIRVPDPFPPRLLLPA